jgi:Uma2 family endonuclease
MAVQFAPSQTETLMTGEELSASGHSALCELVEGRIVPMSPTSFKHGNYEGNFYEHLKAYVRRRKSGKVLVGEVGLYTHRNPDTVRAADVAFISNERLARQSKAGGYLEVAPELVVEILSPDDRWSDVTQKLREYFAVDVRLVWVADPEARVVYAYRSLTDVREFNLADTIMGDDVLPEFSVPVASLFEE